MKKKTLIAIGLVVSMLASTATAFAGTAGTSEYIINENGQQEWVEGNTAGNGSTCGTYTKSTVKEYMIAQGNDGTMVTVKEDPEITGSHNGKMYIIVYNDGAREYIRNGKTSHIIEPSTTTEPTTSTGNSGNNENTSSGVTIKDGINVKPCPSQAELKAYVKAHPFTDNKVNWDKVTYKVKPDPANGVVGELSDKSIEQYKNYVNLARMCAGLPEITINKENCKKAQCGSAISYLNKMQSHTPTRPVGLTDKQWEDGKYACRYGSIVYWENFKSAVAVCQSFLSEGGYADRIGHRLGCLTDNSEFGIGFVNGAGTEIESGGANVVNNNYFTFPSENFPVEFMQYQQSTFKSNSTSTSLLK